MRPESLFEPISKYEPNAKDWDPKKKLRVQRLDDIIAPHLLPYMYELGNDGKRFLQGVITQLKIDSMLDAESFFGNYILPLYVLHKDGRLNYTIDTKIEQVDYPPYWVEPISGYVLKPIQPKARRARSETFEHNPQTLKAADAVLAALTPELGISINDRPESILEQAVKLQQGNIAYIDDEGCWIRFATILPGVCIRHVSSREPNLFAGPTQVVRRFDLEIWRPDQYQSVHPNGNY